MSQTQKTPNTKTQILMKQFLHLLGKRELILSEYPNSTPTQLVNIIRIHSLLFHHEININDFDTQSKWSPKCVGSTIIEGATKDSTKLQAIHQVCSRVGIPLPETNDAKYKASFVDHLQNVKIDFAHFVTWKHSNRLEEIKQSFWRNRDYLCPSDFVAIVPRKTNHLDLAEYKISASHLDSKIRIQHCVSEIAKKFGKRYEDNELPDQGIPPQSTYNPSRSRKDIQMNDWMSHHPYFKYVQYNKQGFIFLPTETIEHLRPDRKKIYEAFLHDNMTRALAMHWRNDLAEDIVKQREAYHNHGFSIDAFQKCEEWSLPELFYFNVCPPAPVFSNRPAQPLDNINQEIHTMFHFNLSSIFRFHLRKKKKKGQPTDLILRFETNVGNHFGCEGAIEDGTDHRFLIGDEKILEFFQKISTQYLIPLSAFSLSPEHNDIEYIRLRQIEEAMNTQFNHQMNAADPFRFTQQTQ